jgi:hypothetical protein
VKEQLVRRLLTNDDDALTVEVKADFRAADTGKTYVEIACNGRPSGIMTTEASYWAVVLPGDTALMVPIERMRQLVEDSIAEGLTARMGRGSHPTVGALIPLQRLVGVDLPAASVAA